MYLRARLITPIVAVLVALPAVGQFHIPKQCSVEKLPPYSETVRKFIFLEQFDLRLSVPANYVPLSREGGSVYIVSKEVHDYFSSIAEGGSLPVDGLGYHAIRVEYLSPQVVHTLKFQGVFDGPYSYKFSFRQQQVTLATSKGGSSDTGATAYIPIKDGRAIAISSICDCLGALETVTRLLIESDKAET